MRGARVEAGGKRGAQDAPLRRERHVARHREHRERPPPRQRVAASRLIDVSSMARHCSGDSARCSSAYATLNVTTA